MMMGIASAYALRKKDIMTAILLSSAVTKRAVSMTCLAAVMLAGIATSGAAQITIVALGTSNTRGRGLPPQQSYPAQLQAMLRAKGENVQVINMGVNGDTTAGMLARLNSVPSGTRLVLLEYSPVNEAQGGITNTAANLAAIQGRLAARNIKSIVVTGIVQSEHRAARSTGNLISTPAGPHLNATAYGDVAAQVLPQVEAAVGR
jgi:acyl-CoA thioesterase-1